MPHYIDPPRNMSEQGDLEIIRELGEGAEGRIDLVRSNRTGKLFAAKTCKPSKWVVSGYKPREVQILNRIYHRHIIKLNGYRLFDSPRSHGLSLGMIYDYCSGGDLHDYREGRTNGKFLLHIFRQMASALAYLHSGYDVVTDIYEERWTRVVHCDIRPANIFLKRPRTTEEPFPDVILGDFGFATTERYGKDPGYRCHQPPEVPITSAAGDVWSLGSTIYEMAHGRPPIDDIPRGFRGKKHEWEVLPRAKNPRPLPSMYSSLLNSMVMDCLEIDPKDRLTSVELANDLRKAR